MSVIFYILTALNKVEEYLKTTLDFMSFFLDIIQYLLWEFLSLICFSQIISSV